MFVRRLNLIRFAFAMAGALFITSGFAGEPIEFSKEKSKQDKEKDPAERQETNRASSLSSRLFRAYRPSETVSGSDLFKSGSVISTPRPSAPPPSSKRNEELLDRQKNWIFLTPKDEKKTDGVNEAFGIDDSNPLERKKGVLARFLENKPAVETKLDDKDSEKSGILKDPNGDFSKTKETRTSESPTTSSLQPQFFERNFAGSESEKTRFGDLWRDQYGPGSTRLREEKQARMKEFEGLFSSQNNSVASGDGFGVVNGPINLGAPLTAAPNRGVERFNSSAATSSSDPYKSTIRAVSESSILATPAINSRVFGSTPAPASSLEPVKSISQPVVLPFPKRHF